MPINSNIAMGVNPIRFKQRDPYEDFSKQSQLQALMTSQADDELTRTAMRDSGGDSESMLKRLITGGGSLKAVTGVQKMIADQAAAKSKMAHEGAQTGKLLSETEAAGIAKHRDMLSMVRDPQTAAQWIQMGYADPVIGKRFQSLVPMDQAIQSIPQDPAEFQSWVQKQGLGATKFIEMNKPVLHNRNLGNVDELTSTPGLGGAPTVLSSRDIKENEAQRLTRERQAAQDKATLAQSAAQFAARQTQSERHHTDNQKRSRTTYDPARGGLVDMQTGEFKPAMQGGVPIGPKATPLKDAPASVQKAMMENSSNLRKAQNALDLIEGKQVGVMQGDTDATGWKGFAPDFALNRLDPDGVDTRAAIADLGSMIIHERSGAAVTAAEFPRLQPFIPKPNDAPEVAKKKLQRFVQVYNEELTAMQNAYGPDSGYRQPGGITPKPPGTPKRIRLDAQGNVIP